jgi:class 3 adenylate cyclase
MLHAMAERGERFLSLTLKVDLILVVALAAGIGAVMAAFTFSLLGSRERLTRDNLVQQGEILYTSIENFMIPGDAPIAVKFFEKVSLASPDYSIRLYRRDGTAAFSDNQTIDRVNANQKFKKFERRDAIAAAAAMPDRPRLDKATSLPPESVFFRDDAGGRAYFRAYRPLINLPKCTACHGSDHTVRGVIDIRSDVTSVVVAQNLTLGAGFVGFFVVVGALALTLGSFLRRVVLDPVRKIGRLCSDVAGGSFEGRVEVRGRDEIGELARTVNTMVEGLYERYELTKYVSTGTIGAIKEKRQEPKRVERSLLFTDVRGFTSYTESKQPERVVEILNRLLDRQSAVIQENGGTIDKFVGDEIVAYFQDEDGPTRACRSALAIARLCEEEKEANDGLSVGIGIATGAVILGMVGSSRRADFTVIGDPVNIASRLCSLAKGGQIIASDSTRSRAAGSFAFRGPLAAKLKGKAEPQRVWILLGPAGPAEEGS